MEPDFKVRPSGRAADHLHDEHDNGKRSTGYLRVLGLLVAAVYAPGLAGLIALAVLDGWPSEFFTLWILWPVLIPSQTLGADLFGFHSGWTCCVLFWSAMLLFATRFRKNPDQAISAVVILGGLSVLQLGLVFVITMIFHGVSF